MLKIFYATIKVLRWSCQNGGIGGRSVEKGALGWECWDGSMGTGEWVREHGDGRVETVVS